MKENGAAGEKDFFTHMEKGVHTTSRMCNWLAILSVTVMMVLTVCDVVLRMFRRPITGTYEIVGLLGAAFVSFSLAYTSIEHGHIAVDFLIRRFRLPVQRGFEGVTSFVCAALFGMVTWQGFTYAAHIRQTGEVSLTLQVPLYPFVYGMAFGSGLLCIVLLFRFLQWVIKR